MEYTEEYIEEVIKECQEAQRWNLGPRVEITDIPGHVRSSAIPFVTNPVARIHFHDTLTPKQRKFIVGKIMCHQMYDICGIGRIMNQKDCGFQTAAKEYFSKNKL